MNQLDLCSGVGVGFSLAGLRLGFSLIGVSEVDPFCSEILSLRYPGVKNYGDVKGISKVFQSTDRLHLLTASPPCQPFSVRGKRKGAEDPRDCFPHVLRAIAVIRPRYFCIENVTGLLNCPYHPRAKSGTYFGNLLWLLYKIGYDVEWQTISSGHFGSPWLRERLIMVGIAYSNEFKLKPRAWDEQIRISIETIGGDKEGRGFKAGIPREWIGCSTWMDRSTGQEIHIGIPSGDGIVRKRRKSLGNALDPRVASVALKRVLYLESLRVK